MRSAHRGRRLRVALLGIVLGTTSGCGFLNDLAHPEAQAAAAEPSAVAVVPAVVPPPADAPVVIAEGDLLMTGGGALGHLVVTQGPVRTGLVPPVPLFSEGCPVDGPSLQYVAVDFTYTTTNDHHAPQPGLAAHVTVDRGPATPADVGDVGIFADSGGDPGPYCGDYPPLPTTDRFWNQMGAATVTVYVVVDRAVGPAFPDGRADVFPTLVLEISELRWFRDPGSVRTWAWARCPWARPVPMTRPRSACRCADLAAASRGRWVPRGDTGNDGHHGLPRSRRPLRLHDLPPHRPERSGPARHQPGSLAQLR